MRRFNEVRSKVRDRDARPGLVRRLFRVAWVLSLTGTALAAGVYWHGTAHCPAPCRIDGTMPQAMIGKSKPMLR